MDIFDFMSFCSSPDRVLSQEPINPAQLPIGLLANAFSSPVSQAYSFERDLKSKKVMRVETLVDSSITEKTLVKIAAYPIIKDAYEKLTAQNELFSSKTSKSISIHALCRIKDVNLLQKALDGIMVLKKDAPLSTFNVDEWVESIEIRIRQIQDGSVEGDMSPLSDFFGDAIRLDSATPSSSPDCVSFDEETSLPTFETRIEVDPSLISEDQKGKLLKFISDKYPGYFSIETADVFSNERILDYTAFTRVVEGRPFTLKDTVVQSIVEYLSLTIPSDNPDKSSITIKGQDLKDLFEITPELFKSVPYSVAFEYLKLQEA
jgi:hypothetical protein